MVVPGNRADGDGGRRGGSDVQAQGRGLGGAGARGSGALYDVNIRAQREIKNIKTRVMPVSASREDVVGLAGRYVLGQLAVEGVFNPGNASSP